MKKRHYTESELEGLVEKQGSGDAHLAECPLCREKLDFLARFHEAISKVSQEPQDPRVEALVQRLSGRNVIRLHSFVSQPDLSQLGVRSDVVVLAAQGGAEGAGRFVTVGSFAGEREHVLLRVVHDRDNHRYSLYLLTKKPEAARHARLIITVQGGVLREEVTDASGVAILEEDPSINWREAVVAVELHLQ